MAVNRKFEFLTVSGFSDLPFFFFFKQGTCTVLLVFLLKKYEQLQRLYAYIGKRPMDTYQSLQKQN